MRSRLSRLSALALATSSAAFAVVVTTTAAHAASAPYEPDPQSVGTISFYNSAGTQITSGSTNSAPFAAYAVGSSSPRSTDRQAQIQFANPQQGKATTSWFRDGAGAFNAYPVTSGPSVITGQSATTPVVVGAAGDETLEHFAGRSTANTNTDYANIVQIRLRTADANASATPKYDTADVRVNAVTHKWTEVYPTNAEAPQQAPGTFVSLPPARLLDTRSKLGGSTPGKNGTVKLQVTGRGGVPSSNVSAVVLNVTVASPTASGFITAYADGASKPTASNLNFVKGQVVPNVVVAPVSSTNGKVDLFNGSPGSTPLVADVSGYYVGGTPVVNGAYKSLAPARLLDTRSKLGGSTPGKNGTVKLQVTGRGSVPTTNVSAVVLNVTVAGPTASGFITAYADGASKPTASNLNFVKGQVVPNLVVAPVGSDGKVDLFNGSPGSTPLVADVAGYYLGSSGSTAGSAGAFTSLSPARLLDTRSKLGGSTPGKNGSVSLQVDGRGGVPTSNVSAVVLNVTVAGPTASGFITVYGSGTTKPTASNLNFVKGQVVPNVVFAPVGTDGKVVLFNGSPGSTPLIADVSGYYLQNSRG